MSLLPLKQFPSQGPNFGQHRHPDQGLGSLTKPVQCIPGGYRSQAIHQKLVFGYVIPEHRPASHFDALPICIFAKDGTAVGTGSFDLEIEKTSLHLCKAVRIAKRSYKRRKGDSGYESRILVKQDVVYFLLVQPDENNEGAWKRVEVGMTRHVAWRLNYPDFLDLWDWEEFDLT